MNKEFKYHIAFNLLYILGIIYIVQDIYTTIAARIVIVFLFIVLNFIIAYYFNDNH